MFDSNVSPREKEEGEKIDKNSIENSYADAKVKP